MSRVLQFLDEISNDVGLFHHKLLALPGFKNQIDDVNEQLTELERFLYQTEISMACLEKAYQLINGSS